MMAAAKLCSLLLTSNNNSNYKDMHHATEMRPGVGSRLTSCTTWTDQPIALPDLGLLHTSACYIVAPCYTVACYKVAACYKVVHTSACYKVNATL